MQTKFLIFIAVVFIITIIFGILIWRQTLVFEKKALAAKQRKEAYLKQMEEELAEQQRAEQLAQGPDQQEAEQDDKTNPIK